jgi:hypothetical protein
VVAVVGRAGGAAGRAPHVEIAGAGDDTLGVEKARDQLLVLARGAHRDAETHAAQPDLERLFDGEMVQTLGDGLLAHFHDAMTNGGHAPRNFEIGI